jgi:hypothetical protein
MKPSERRAAMKKEMEQRLQESYNSKDDSGKFKSIFVKDAVGNTPMWKCSEDEHFINIIPFIAGKNNPNTKPGQFAYSLDIFVHRKVGINEDSYICLARSYGKKCPICDEQAELRKQDDYDEKYVKSLNPTRRVIYNIECLDSDKEVKKGIQLFEVSHYLFEKELAEIAKKPRGGGFILFSDPDEGKTVFFRKSGNGPTNTEYKAFKFEDREEPVSDEILDSALCLDELIHIPTYDEVYNAFHGNDGGEEIPEEQIIERAAEAEQSRRPASRGASAVKPAEKEPEPAADAEFQYPCSSSADFGSFEACENCPDVGECEAEFNEAERVRLEAEQVRIQKEKEEAEKNKPANTETAAPVSRRPRRGESTDAPANEVAKETVAAPADAPAGRVRRRPGA